MNARRACQGQAMPEYLLLCTIVVAVWNSRSSAAESGAPTGSGEVVHRRPTRSGVEVMRAIVPPSAAEALTA